MKVTPKAVQQELWVSFVGLLRSYVAAHEIGRRRDAQQAEIHEAEVQGHQVTIRSGSRTLVVSQDDGEGRWTLSRDTGPEPQQGSFVLHQDGTVEFSDRKGTLDLEVAAEALTSRVLDDE